MEASRNLDDKRRNLESNSTWERILQHSSTIPHREEQKSLDGGYFSQAWCFRVSEWKQNFNPFH